MIFIHKCKACPFTGKSRVIIQERFHIKVNKKFIKIKNFRSYCICQNTDHSMSTKMNRCVWKNCLNVWRVISIIQVFVVKNGCFFSISFLHSVFWRSYENHKAFLKIKLKLI